MKDFHEVLKQKELEIQRVETEIQALHAVIPLLAEPADWAQYGLVPPVSASRQIAKSV